MKNKKYLIIMLLICLFPIKAKAYTLECDSSSISYDNNFFCYLKGETNINYNILSGEINSTDDLVTCNTSTISNGLNILESSSGFSYSGTPTEENLITFSCKLNKQLTSDQKVQIVIDNFSYKTGNGTSDGIEKISTDFITANKYTETEEVDTLPRNTSNPDSLLKVLYDDNLNIVFSRFITTYTQEVLYEVDSLDLKVTANNNDATIRIEGNGVENNTKLNVGKNTINIFVTSPDGSSTTCYSLYVTRLARGESIYYPEKDATLASLIIPGYSISFDKDTYEYKVHITSDVSSLNINATPTYEGASVDISSADNLVNGSTIKVTVTSKDKSTTLEYIIRITKDAAKKNYTTYILTGIVIVILLVLVIIFIKTSQNKKKSSGPTVIPEVDNNSTLNLDSAKVVSENSQEVVNTNLNQVSSTKPTIDLNNQNVITPTPINNEINQKDNQ